MWGGLTTQTSVTVMAIFSVLRSPLEANHDKTKIGLDCYFIYVTALNRRS